MADANAELLPSAAIARSRGVIGASDVAHVRECISLTNVLQASGPITGVSTLAERVKQARAVTGLNQKEFAVRAGVSASAIAMLESGYRQGTNIDTLRGISRAAGVTLEWLKDDGPDELPAQPRTLSGRLEFVRESAGLTPDELLELAGVALDSLATDFDAASRVAAKTGFNALWIMRGKQPARPLPPVSDDRVGEPIILGQPRGIPVRGIAKMGRDGHYDEIEADGGYIPFFGRDNDVYALEVRGQSMHPAIREGHYVLVSPSRKPEPPCYVLIKLVDGQRMVKELLAQKGGYIQVLSINGNERISFQPDEIEAVHAVIGQMDPVMWKT